VKTHVKPKAFFKKQITMFLLLQTKKKKTTLTPLSMSPHSGYSCKKNMMHVPNPMIVGK